SKASKLRPRGCGSVGRASPCQGEGRGFESRHPLGGPLSRPPSRSRRAGRGGVAERRGSGLQSRIRGFESHLHLADSTTPRAIGAAVARFPDTEEVTGSIPVSPTSTTREAAPAPSGAASRVPTVTRTDARSGPEVG